jgi:hypothetical protein
VTRIDPHIPLELSAPGERVGDLAQFARAASRIIGQRSLGVGVSVIAAGPGVLRVTLEVRAGQSLRRCSGLYLLRLVLGTQPDGGGAPGFVVSMVTGLQVAVVATGVLDLQTSPNGVCVVDVAAATGIVLHARAGLLAALDAADGVTVT